MRKLAALLVALALPLPAYALGKANESGAQRAITNAVQKRYPKLRRASLEILLSRMRGQTPSLRFVAKHGSDTEIHGSIALRNNHVTLRGMKK